LFEKPGEAAEALSKLDEKKEVNDGFTGKGSGSDCIDIDSNDKGWIVSRKD
jgi:hypothetical protein